jgi:TonB family protein
MNFRPPSALRLVAAAIVLLAAGATFGAADGVRTAPPKPPKTRVQPPPAPRAPASTGTAIEGMYAVEGSSAMVRVKMLFDDMYHLTSTEGWEGVGMFDGTTYRGVFRINAAPGSQPGGIGSQTVDWAAVGSPSAHFDYPAPRAERVVQHWRRADEPGVPPAEKGVTEDETRPGHRPAFGEHVNVEELPEAITKVPPNYPDAARAAGAQGTVLVQALVLEDGTVGDWRVVQSVPGLDEAAVAAVRQWRFKPALNKGVPVAVWVAVPVKFTLH